MSVETAILRALFPEGFAPIERLPEIQKAIGNLILISQGNVKISDPGVNRILNSKIVKGKDEDHKTWIQIQEGLRAENVFLTIDAVRHRYSGAKREARARPAEGPAQVVAAQEIQAKPEAEVKAEVKQAFHPPRIGPKIPHNFDARILEERKEGRKFREIHVMLLEKGVLCSKNDVTARYQQITKDTQKARLQEPKAMAEQVKPGALKPFSSEVPKHKELSDKELDAIIADWHEGGATNFEISRRIEHEHYVTFTPMEIGQRIQGLRTRGAI